MELPNIGTVFSFAVVASLLTFAGCGTNKFEQEVKVEEAAIKLHNETELGKYDLISTEQLKKLIDSDQKVILLDAMPPDSSYNKGHIAGAINFEFPKEVMKQWDEKSMGQRTKQEYEQMLGAEKDRTIVVYCGFVKCARSHNAAVYALELGYKNVKRYPGGIHAWRGAGHSLTKD
jgi:rhodanese-related sulfurtransferase